MSFQSNYAIFFLEKELDSPCHREDESFSCVFFVFVQCFWTYSRLYFVQHMTFCDGLVLFFEQRAIFGGIIFERQRK